MEPKDYEDLYGMKDSEWLRQMSLQNAQMALEQAKLQYQSHSIDLENMYDTLARRINGGDTIKYHSLLDRLKDEFESKRLLNIQNFGSLVGTKIHYNGDEWLIDSIEELTTAYIFKISKELVFGKYEVNMSLNRIADGKVYTIQNDNNGSYKHLSKEVLKDKTEFLKVLVGLTDEYSF